MWIERATPPSVLRIALALISLGTPAVAQQTVCGEGEYAAWLRKSPPPAEYLRFPPPPGGRLDIQQSIAEAYPRRAFSQTFVYRMPQGTRAADVIGFYKEAGLIEPTHDCQFKDVNPRHQPGDQLFIRCSWEGGQLTVETVDIYRATRVPEGTPFGDIAWIARELRDHPPTAADLALPLYPSAVMDLDLSTQAIVCCESVVYFTSDGVETVKRFYGVPADQETRQISQDNPVHLIYVKATRSKDPQRRTRIDIVVPTRGPGGHLRGPGPAVDGPPPGWKPRKWRGGCYRGQVEPITPTGAGGERSAP